jgi:glycerate kinase
MKIVIAPDSFKGSLSAAKAAAAMAAGVQDAWGEAIEIIQRPMADGGEGTLEVIATAWGVALQQLTTVDAIGRPRQARVGLSADGRRAIVEAAEANGLPHVSDVALQPLRADTFGVGLIARELLDRGVEEILLCVGGSATTDGGTGFLTALGARFLGTDGEPVAPGGGGLPSIVSCDVSGLHARAREVTWSIAVDVDNPLWGERGAAATFGPQKGATSEDIQILDAGLKNLARVLATATGSENLTGPGFGAAGGMPLGLVALLGAQLQPGSQLVAEAIGLTEALTGATLVLTGEGAFDHQSLSGKVIDRVLASAPADCKVVVIAGQVHLTKAETDAAGVFASFALADEATDLATVIATAGQALEKKTAEACRLLGQELAG